MIDPDGVTVRTAADGSFIVEDEDDYQELFRIDPSVELPDLIRQVIAIANKRERIGRGTGRRELQDEFRRLMSLARI